MEQTSVDDAVIDEAGEATATLFVRGLTKEAAMKIKLRAVRQDITIARVIEQALDALEKSETEKK